MYEILEILMREYNVRASDIAKATGISSSAFTDWKKGRYTPKIDKLEKIAGYFGLDAKVFFLDAVDLPAYVEHMRRTKDRVTAYSDAIYDVAAGEPRYNPQVPTEFMSEESHDEDCSWCRVHGESMSPLLMDGDLVRVHHQTETTPQDLTAIKIDGDSVTIKRVEVVENGIWLRAENKAVYEDKFYGITDVLTLPIVIIGKVVESRRSF